MEAKKLPPSCEEASLQLDGHEREADQTPSSPFHAEATTCADDNSQLTESAPSRSSGLQSRLKVPFADLTFHARIGKGSFKQVYRGKWNNTNVAIVAMRRGGLVTEARLMQQLGSHPNLVQFYRWSTDHRGNEYIVVELVPFGSLDKVLVQFGPMLRNRSKLMMCEQICHAMCALAAEGVLHRDLAARNILVQSMQPVHVKVSDFGLARSSALPGLNQLTDAPQRRGLSDDSEPPLPSGLAAEDSALGTYGAEAAQQEHRPRARAQVQAEMEGQQPQTQLRQGKPKGGATLVPVRWSAPEVLRTGDGWSEKSDVYSYGVTMWEIFSNGAEPYANRSDVQAAASIVSGVLLQRPKNCPHQVYALMLDCWNPEPAKRPSFAHIADIYRRWREMTLAARASGSAVSSAASRAVSVDGMAAATAVGPGAAAATSGLRTLSGPSPPMLNSPPYPEHPQPPALNESGGGGGSGGYLSVSSLLVGHHSHAPGPKALPAIPSGEILHLVGQSPPQFQQLNAQQQELQRQIELQQRVPPPHQQPPEHQHLHHGQPLQPQAFPVGPSLATVAAESVAVAAGSPGALPTSGRPHDSASSAPYEGRYSDGCGYGAPVRARSCGTDRTDNGGGVAAANGGAVRVIGQGRRSCILPDEQRKRQESLRESHPCRAASAEAAVVAEASAAVVVAEAEAVEPAEVQLQPYALVDAEAHATVGAAVALPQPPPMAHSGPQAAAMGGTAALDEPALRPAAPAAPPATATAAAAQVPHGVLHSALRTEPSSSVVVADPGGGADGVGVCGGGGLIGATGSEWQGNSGHGLFERKRSAPLQGPQRDVVPEPSACRRQREAAAQAGLQRRNTAGTLSRPSPLGLGTSRLVPELSRRSSCLSSQTTMAQTAGFTFSRASAGANQSTAEHRSESIPTGATTAATVAAAESSGARRSMGRVLSRFEGEGPARLLRMAAELTGETHGTHPSGHASGAVAVAAVMAATMGACGSVHGGGGRPCVYCNAAATSASQWSSLGGGAAAAGGADVAGSSAGALFGVCETCLLSMEVETAIDPMLSCSTAMLSTINRTVTNRDGSGAAQLNSPMSLAAAAALVALRGQRRVSGLGRRPESGASEGALESGLDSLHVITHAAALGAALREAATDTAAGPILTQPSPTGRSSANAADSTRGTRGPAETPTTTDISSGDYAAAREPSQGGGSPGDSDAPGRAGLPQPQEQQQLHTQPLRPHAPAAAMAAGILAGHLLQAPPPQLAAAAAAPAGPPRSAAAHSPYMSIRMV